MLPKESDLCTVREIIKDNSDVDDDHTALLVNLFNTFSVIVWVNISRFFKPATHSAISQVVLKKDQS